jgi:hypothetical protein
VPLEGQYELLTSAQHFTVHPRLQFENRQCGFSISFA